MELALTSRVLIGCRLSPVQKAEIVTLIREYQPKKVTLAVGDGVNDICMLNAAHIPVSVVSSNASHQFRDGSCNTLASVSAYSVG